MVPVNLLGTCDVDVTYYPFDSQTCVLKLSSWQYKSSEVMLSFLDNSIETTLFEANGEWELESTDTNETLAVFHASTWSVLVITFNVKRKFTYYIINMVLPVVVLNVLGVLVFTLPSESGDKIGFSLTVLLSLSVVLTVLADTIPTTSLNVCILSVYLLVGFILSALEVVMAVVVLKLFTNGDQDKPVSGGVQTFARSILARLSCTDCGGSSRTTKRKADDSADDYNSSMVDVRRVKSIASNKVMTLEEVTKLELESNGADSGQYEQILYTWKDISRMVDYICLYLFAFVTFAYTTVFMLMLLSKQLSIFE